MTTLMSQCTWVVGIRLCRRRHLPGGRYCRQHQRLVDGAEASRG